MPSRKPTDWDKLWNRYRRLVPDSVRGFRYWRSQPGDAKNWDNWLRVIREIEQLDRYLARAIQTRHRDDIVWLSRALKDDEKKWMVADACRLGNNVPKHLFEGMLRAAVYESNPSRNKEFINPCIKKSGSRRVILRLLAYLELGGNFEKAGAVRALYWAWRGADCDDLVQRERDMFLTEFVRNDDLDVRRSLIPALELRSTNAFSESIRPLVKQAVKIARGSADEYIRHRVEIQLGAPPPYKPIPQRGTPTIQYNPLQRVLRALQSALRLRSR